MQNHCLEILHYTWQLKGKITDYAWTVYSYPQSEKKIFSPLCFCNSHQQQMHTTNMHKTFHRHLRPLQLQVTLLPALPSAAEQTLTCQQGLCLHPAASRRLPVCSACHGVLLMGQYCSSINCLKFPLNVTPQRKGR